MHLATILHVAKILGIMFSGAVIASLAEKVFKYSLFDTVVGVIKKLFTKKA